MKRVAVFTLILLFICGIAYAKNYEVKKKAGEFNVEVTIDKNPPIVGDNNMTVRIKDASNKDVTDAKVKIEYSMPAMPGMPAMNYKADAALKGNEYRAKLNFSMSGAWNVAVKITRGNKTTPVKLSVDVR